MNSANKLIIGSTSGRHWFSDYREPKDLDIMTEEPMMTKEQQHYWFGDSSNLLLEHNKDNTYIDADLLLTLKLSHAGWDIWWDKTIFDILFLKKKGLKANKTIYKSLVKDFTRIHGKRWASLEKKDNMNFFEDAVTRKYVHDEIHEAIAVYDRPLYERCLKEDGKVGCSGEKFNQLSYNDQILMVKEEVWVTALERYLIPNNFDFAPRRAYMRSLKKLATTMSSGWFKFFILDNFENLYKCNDLNYIEKFKQKENKLTKV